MTSIYAVQKMLSGIVVFASAPMCFLALSLCTGGCSGDRDLVSLSPSELAVTNQILAEEDQLRLDREDFKDPQRTTSLLHVSVGGHYEGSYTVASSASVRAMGDLAHWVRGKEKNEAVLTQLCGDPGFKFEDDKWTVIFNVLRSDGGVDQWFVAGAYDPESRTNRIEKAEARQLKPKGTFFYQFAG